MSETKEPADSVMEFKDNQIELGPNDAIIAIMGMTGAGKSTFIKHCTREEIKIGHTLQSCTQEVGIYVCEYATDSKIYLIDTPGFDDTDRSDTEVLKEVASSLTHLYKINILLDGIIYLHRISDVRVPGSAIRNLRTFKKLCGDNALPNVILATTMWEGVDEKAAIAREKELKSQPKFWSLMIHKGSTVFRHENTRQSAMKLLEYLVKRPPNLAVPLTLQTEMVEDRKDLADTEAGQEVDGGLERSRRQAEDEINDLKSQLEEANHSHDEIEVQALREEVVEKQRAMERLVQDQKDLKISIERLWEERYAKIKEDFERSEREKAEIYEKLEKINIEREEEHANVANLERQLTDLRENPKVRSHPGENTIGQWCVSAALHGEYYWFVAKMRDTGKLPPEFAEIGQEGGDGNYYVAFGDQSTWYRYYAEYNTNGRVFKTAFSDNFEEVYPVAHQFLSNSPGDEPVCISLGSDGEYFVRTTEGVRFNFSEKTSMVLTNPENFESVWLGKDNSYIAQRYRADQKRITKPSWNLRGLYPNLDDELKTSKVRIKTISLNLLDPEQCVLIYENGSTIYNKGLNYKLDKLEYEEWCTKNFGTHWTDGDSGRGMAPPEPKSVFVFAPRKHVFRFWKN